LKLLKSFSSHSITDGNSAFKDLIATLRSSLTTWDYFVNWTKVSANAQLFKSQLGLLNGLVGAQDFDSAFDALLRAHPDVVSAIPSLLVRDGSSKLKFSIVQDPDNLSAPDLEFDFAQPANTPQLRREALEFVKSSGIIQLFGSSGVTDLQDFVRGVEAGLDSNGRKNRSGKSMERVVDGYLENFVAGKGLEYLRQATPSDIKEAWGFVVPSDESIRSFDFAVSDRKSLVVMEVNFYGGGGSKLKATAGEYKGLHDFLGAAGHKFVWITDGAGWRSTHKPLREAFDHLDYLWNLEWLNRGYLKELF
jgi:type II restriction enzyme